MQSEEPYLQVTYTIPHPDLGLSIAGGTSTPAPGQTIPYTLNYSNTGGTGSTGVTLTDTLPANTTFNAAASSPGWTLLSGSTYQFPVGAVAGSGGSGSVVFAVTVNSPLSPGMYTLTNTAAIADDGANGSDANIANNSFTVASPAFGVSAVTGNIFNDANNNGLLNAGESGLSGWTVTLTPTGGTSGMPISVATAPNGAYTFPSVAPGTYNVSETLASGYALTAPLGGSATVSVTAGQALAGPIFGNARVSPITLGFNMLVALSRITAIPELSPTAI